MVVGTNLILFLADLLAIAFTGQRFFHALLLTRFQVERVTLDFLDDVFGLHLALEAPQGILKGFAFLYSNLCQEKYTSKPSQLGYSQNTLICQGMLHESLKNCAIRRPNVTDEFTTFGVPSSHLRRQFGSKLMWVNELREAISSKIQILNGLRPNIDNRRVR